MSRIDWTTAAVITTIALIIMAVNVKVTGAAEIKYKEPALNEAHCSNPTKLTQADCTAAGQAWVVDKPLDDLDHCHAKMSIVINGASFWQTPDIPATSASGGGTVTYEVTYPVLKGEAYEYLTCMDDKLNESGPSEIRKRDFLMPFNPEWLN